MIDISIDSKEIANASRQLEGQSALEIAKSGQCLTASTTSAELIVSLVASSAANAKAAKESIYEQSSHQQFETATYAGIYAGSLAMGGNQEQLRFNLKYMGLPTSGADIEDDNILNSIGDTTLKAGNQLLDSGLGLEILAEEVISAQNIRAENMFVCKSLFAYGFGAANGEFSVLPQLENSIIPENEAQEWEDIEAILLK